MVRELNMDPEEGPERITALIAGASRSGKTHFAATFPRPIFIADATEGGYTTIRHMYVDDFYEEAYRPRVIPFTTPTELMEAIAYIDAELKKDPSSIGTVVVDSLTFYGEMKLSELETMDTRRDKRQLYGDLASHLRYVMIQIHKFPVNVLWLALAKEGGEEHALGGVSIPGQTATKAPARCDIWSYLEQIERRKGRETERVFRMHFQTYANFKAGHRFGDILPPSMDNPNYRDLEKILQLKPWAERFAPASKKPKKAS